MSLLTLTSCTSVPLTSMIKMASLDDDDITVINASEVRVRLSLTEPAELETKDVKLVLKFEHLGDTKTEYEYLLEVIDSNKVDAAESWFTSGSVKHQYKFKFSRLSQLEFNKFQKAYLKQGKPKRYNWTVYYHLKQLPYQGEDLTIDMELKFSAQEDFFYLLKNRQISIDK